MNRFLLTRPKEDNEGLAEKLKALGFEVIISPLLSIHYNRRLKDDAVFAAKAQAVIVTSRNAIRALHQAGITITSPLYVVGQGTADLASSLGYAAQMGGDDVESLARHITDTLSPALGGLAYFSGKETSKDLKKLLPQFSVAEVIAYEAAATPMLSVEAAKAVKGKLVDGVMCFSERSAIALLSALQKGGLQGAVQGITCYVFSPTIAKVVSGLLWKEVIISPSPNLASLLSILKKA